MRLKILDGFELSKNLFSNYYENYAFYLNDLPILKNELLLIKEIFEIKRDVKAVNLIEQFLNLIDYAIKSKNMIKAIAD